MAVMKDDPPLREDCTDCRDLGRIIGNDGVMLWCFRYGCKLESENEPCTECKNRPCPEWMGAETA